MVIHAISTSGVMLTVQHQIYPPRKPLTTDQLRNPLRPECTGPRPDNGFPSFPYKVTSGWSIYEHSIKIVKHQIEYDGSAAIAEIHHALHTRPLGVKDVATELLRDMQEIKAGQGVDGMGLRRYLLTTVSKRRKCIVYIIRPSKADQSSGRTLLFTFLHSLLRTRRAK